MHYKRDGNSVQVDIELKEMAGFVDHAGYAARRELLAHLAQAERRPISVRPAATP